MHWYCIPGRENLRVKSEQNLACVIEASLGGNGREERQARKEIKKNVGRGRSSGCLTQF
jgi:hypothetical protein